MIDCHRPYHHNNINEDQSKLLVIHDGCKSFDECPTAEEDRLYQQILDAEDPDASDQYDYDSEYSDLQEAKEELEELKDEDEGENYLEDGIDQDKAMPEGEAESD